MKMHEYQNCNKFVLSFLSNYLNNNPTMITTEDVLSITNCGVDENYAMSLLLSSLAGLNLDKEIDKLVFNEYFLLMIKKEKSDIYLSNPYYQLLKNNVKSIEYKNWTFKWDKYAAYECFVRDDMVKYPNGKILPSIGYFAKNFYYPSIYQENRLWMTITPNEVNTFKSYIDEVKGDVCTCGLGMGYFAYMCTIKDEVKTLTIVEKDEEVIELFKNNLLPLFEYKDKIKIINADAFKYLEEKHNHDYIVIDLWHDVSDGKTMYKKLKTLEKVNPNSIFRYWIEKTIKCYD